MRKQYLLLASLTILALVVGSISFFALDNQSTAQAQDDGGEFTYQGELDAPDFPEDLDWINVSQPLDWDQLEGKLVLLDFWTYGCINCIHIIPDLHQLEEEFGDSLVVIGVHSAKYDNEGVTDNIRQVVQRYGVTHPVVNDNQFEIWQTWGVQAWPTVVLIDPLGKVVGGRSGEGVYEVFQPIIEIMTQEFGDAELINTEPLAALAPEVTPRDDVVLNYPGKVLADTAGNRLIISDSSNHRIIVTDLDTYTNPVVIGTGTPGYTDGDFASAQFDTPQGLAIDGDTLYVADTNNHAIRQINLADGTVETLVGTGHQATSYPPTGGIAPDVDLSSPWDVVLNDGILYIAMAGPHQLWRVDLATGETVAHAGSARENIIDGPLADAQLAQPSGITTDGEILYFADAETSSVRTASIDPAGEVNTIVGTGLFDFGDVDGTGDEVLLQHVLGITVSDNGLLYIADTYNNKIKLINPAAHTSTTLAGSSTEPALVDGDLETARFYEPGGLDYANGKLYIADTNNHAIRVLDLETGIVTTVEFPDTTALLIPTDSTDSIPTALDPVEITLSPTGLEDEVSFGLVSVHEGEGELILDIHLPDGYKLNDAAPFTVLNPTDDIVAVNADYLEYREVLPDLPVHIPVTFNSGRTEFTTELTIYWCEAINYTLCFIKPVTFTATVLVGDTAENNSLMFSYDLVPPEIGE